MVSMSSIECILMSNRFKIQIPTCYPTIFLLWTQHHLSFLFSPLSPFLPHQSPAQMLLLRHQALNVLCLCHCQAQKLISNPQLLHLHLEPDPQWPWLPQCLVLTLPPSQCPPPPPVLLPHLHVPNLAPSTPKAYRHLFPHMNIVDYLFPRLSCLIHTFVLALTIFQMWRKK